MSGSPGGPAELNFKGSECDPEVLGVLESKNALRLFYERCGKKLTVSNFDVNTSMEMLGCQKS